MSSRNITIRLEPGWLKRSVDRAHRRIMARPKRLRPARYRNGQTTPETFLPVLIEMLAAADHKRMGQACGEDACVLCWLEGQAREALSSEPKR